MRKFLVVLDQTPESLKALRFAARRAARTEGQVVMLYVVEPETFQHWSVIEETMRLEAMEEARARLDAVAEEVKAITGKTPETVIREGVKREQVLEQLTADPEIGVLVLGASEDADPGPLVSVLTGQMAGRLPTPVTIVPGGLSLEQIDAVC